MSISIFRSFTEFHTFFNCNMVKKAVIDQKSRTTFGKFLTIFYPSSTVGERHLFDILRTRRQTYTHAWSVLNEELNINRRRKQSQPDDSKSFRPVQSPLANRRSGESDDVVIDLSKSSHSRFTAHDNLNELSNEELKRIVRNLEDSRICQVCMDEEVTTAFCPCGHVVCCTKCSTLCRECPICRCQITYAQRVFFSCE